MLNSSSKIEAHQPKTDRQLKALFKRKKMQGNFSFSDENSFLDWYRSQLSECSICGISEHSLQRLIRGNLLKSKRFPENGKVKRGKARGWWLEVDRNDPLKNYSVENCSLVCYFCNNDKSDVFTLDEYKEFSKNRMKYLKNLENRLV
jgi:hypothetical protein